MRAQPFLFDNFQPPDTGMDDGTPTIFLDSHPSEAVSSYLGTFYSAIKRDLAITFTGAVERALSPGELRLKWYTHEGNEGFKDYPLHQYAQVRKDFEEVLKLEDVRRATVLGFPRQNPYVVGAGGKNPWVERFEREKKGKKGLGMRPEVIAKGGDGCLDIEALVEGAEKEDERQRAEAERKERERIEEETKERRGARRGVDEEEGLLSGEMV